MLHVLALILSILSPVAPYFTIATRYADTPRDEGGVPACWRRCLQVGPGGSCAQHLSDADFDAAYPVRVASRSLRCGTRVLIVSRATGRIALGIALDRGPWNLATPAWQRSHRLAAPAARPRSVDPGPGPHYRGDLDLSPAVADALGLSLEVGRMQVSWWVVR